MLTVLYGTETGMAREIAERIAALAVRTGLGPCVQWMEMDDMPITSWLSLDGPVVFVCSTTGQGDTPTTMKNTWDSMLLVDCPRLEGLKFAVFGLGDSTYAKYNFRGKTLHNRLVQLGAEPIVNRGLGDEQDGNSHDEELVPWLEDLWPALAVALGKPASEVKTEFDAFKLEQQPESARRPVTIDFVPSVSVVEEGKPADGPEMATSDDEEYDESTDAADTAAAEKKKTTLPQFDLVVSQVTRLTADNHFQNVSQIDFVRPAELETFEPTDAIGLLPQNAESDVDYLAARYGDPLVRVTPNFKSYSRQPRDALVEATRSGPQRLSTLLRHHLDLRATARRPLFALLARCTEDVDEIERLTELAVVVPEYDRYCWREKRSTIEILQDFANLNPPLDSILSVIPRLDYRWYSVASDPHPDVRVVSLCAALLEFKTPMNRLRYGTCSRQLVDAKPGDVWRNCSLRIGARMPPLPAADENNSRTVPHVLIGPGTGIAPCRSLWSWINRHSASARAIVFTGNRQRAKDYLYGNELADLIMSSPEESQSCHAHHAAFSRENPPQSARYVQHAIVAHADEVAAALEDPRCVIFVSGNSKRMPQDVEDTLVSIIKNRVDGHGERPELLLRLMKREGRYMQDTWS